MQRVFNLVMSVGAGLLAGSVVMSFLLSAMHIGTLFRSSMIATGAILLMAGMLGSALGSVVSSRKASGDTATQASAEGRVALAKVLSIRATATSVNQQPVCALDVIVDARDRGPYQTQFRALINVARLPSMQPGAIVVVVRPDLTRPDVQLLDPAPADWQQRAEQDTRLRALNSAPVWTLATPAAESRAARWGKLTTALGVAVGLGVAVWSVHQPLWLLIQGKSSTEVVETVEEARREARSIFAAEDLRAALGEVFSQAGSSSVSQVSVHQTLLTVTGPDGTASYDWVNGTVSPSSTGSFMTGEDAPPFDATALDWSLIEKLVAEAPRLSGLDDTPYFSLTGSADNPTGVEVEMYVSGDGDEFTQITTDGTGRVLSMSGGAPGSPAAEWAGAER